MKYNSIILEAVSRGIKLALDDYQDIENNNSMSHTNDVIDSEDIIKNKIEFWKDWVDLGLPSGTRWCKYNLGCDFDLLKNNPDKATVNDWYGKYYSWGETYDKPRFDEKSYSYSYGFKSTKYNKEDRLDRILPEDDAATIYFNNTKIHIPTAFQCEELLANTTRRWTNDYGAVGYILTSKINENEIFIPAAGYYEGGEDILNEGKKAVLMTNDLSNYGGRKDLCKSMIIKESTAFISNTLYRSCGISIRPVINVK